MRLLFFILFPISFAYCQHEIKHQNQVWFGYYLTIPLHNQWYLQGEVHERYFIKPFLYHQSAFRAHFHRPIGDKWDFSLGAALFLNTPNDEYAKIRLAVPEYRPHLDIVYKNYWGIFRFEQRFRSEMRFNRGTTSNRSQLADDINFINYRLRYRIQAQFPLFKSISGKLNSEILLNAGQENPKNVLDQHRMFVGLTIPLHKSISLDFGYLHAFQQRSNLDYYDRSILSLMLYHRIN
jgi:hypothetical protein